MRHLLRADQGVAPHQALRLTNADQQMNADCRDYRSIAKVGTIVEVPKLRLKPIQQIRG